MLRKSNRLLLWSLSRENLKLVSARTHSAKFTRTITRGLLTQSYDEGPTHPPLVFSTLSKYFETELLAKHAHRPALICRHEQPRAHGGPVSHNLGRTDVLAWSYAEFHDNIQALARGLLSMGVGKGDRVAVVMGNCR